MSEFQEQPNRSKPEIKSSKHTVAEGMNNDQKSPKELKKGISKKQLAQRLIASAVIATGLGISADDVSKGSFTEEPRGVHRELSVQDLEQRVEKLYQVQIISPQESKVLTLSNGEQVQTEEWPREELADLAGFLDKLPAHFYLPSPKIDRFYLPARGFGGSNMTESKLQQLYENAYMSDLKEHFGKEFKISKEELRKAISQKYFERQEGLLPVSFILTNDLPANRQFGVDVAGKSREFYTAYCYCDTSRTNSIVLLTPSVFRRDSVDKFSTVVHELTHFISKDEDYKFVRELLGVNRSEKFSDFNDYVLKDLEKINYQKAVLKTAGVHEGRAHADFYYGATNPDEFVSVASQFYVAGKDVFAALYSMHIGEQKAEQFYDYMKDNIFRGTEYKGYQKINK